MGRPARPAALSGCRGGPSRSPSHGGPPRVGGGPPSVLLDLDRGIDAQVIRRAERRRARGRGSRPARRGRRHHARDGATPKPRTGVAASQSTAPRDSGWTRHCPCTGCSGPLVRNPKAWPDTTARSCRGSPGSMSDPNQGATTGSAGTSRNPRATEAGGNPGWKPIPLSRASGSGWRAFRTYSSAHPKLTTAGRGCPCRRG
jgi:hypothetical protein